MTNIHSNSSLYMLHNGSNRMFMYFTRRKDIYAHAHCVCVCILIHTCVVQLCHILNYSFELAIVNLSSCKSCKNQLNLWTFDFISLWAPAPTLLSVAQHYETPGITTALQKTTASLWAL